LIRRDKNEKFNRSHPGALTGVGQCGCGRV
jgi:hypothetical protein